MLIHCTQVTYQERNQNYQTFEHIKILNQLHFMC